ncbi:3-keto-disaccharide hydrolase [Pseudoduganella namucuonensis]|uniref:3-keto-alpha-glucoside-1,2-lyase/3-keto-2-hydroxy-glucal hydratase domain-containing protein n=1 Tax=Pseudoduganella namucuonensis TaxID=1035707 RepID=A0A1I7KW59_9BURK|nr:DUF1080 domain-containing protein [Pseudoduganella namucuonensis]SFV01713.1 protein of unknown function [Pseudoduganella namucuonensis]
MKISPLRLFARLAALFAVSAAACAADPQQPAGFADPVLGRWNLTVTAKDGTQYPSWFDIRLRKESELMAEVVGRFGSTRHATAVEYSKGKLQLRVPRQYEQDISDLVFDGALVDEQLVGTTTNEDGAVISWSAQRAPELPRKGRQKWGKPVELFNGRNLNGWRPQHVTAAPCWQIENGLLTNAAPCTNLISDATFGDFKVRMEFMNVAGGNSGLYLRGRYEVQISDAYGLAVDPLRMGAVYGHVRPQANASRKAGEWQTLEVTLSGRFVTVVLNGVTVIDGQEIPGITGGALDSRETEAGPLLLQGDHTKVFIRKLSVARSLN